MLDLETPSWPHETALGLVLGVINLVLAAIVTFLLFTIDPAAVALGRWFLPLLLAGEFAGGVTLRLQNRPGSRLLFIATLVSAVLIALVALVVAAISLPRG